MHEPTPRPEAKEAADPAAVLGSSLRPLPAANRWVFQGGEDARAAAARSWPPGFSSQSCRASTDGRSASLWMGPDEFLLISPDQISLAESLGGIPHSLVDVSHRQLGFELVGPNCAALLSGGCPLDLDLKAFPVRMCTRTVFAKADIVLWRKADDVFQVEVWRSFYEYTTQLLAELARG
jgi:sarcosine oxidase subunit gamma